MADLFPPLAFNVPIVDPKTGYPSSQFQRLMQQLSLSAELVSGANGAIGIAPGGVTNAMLANMAAHTIKGNAGAAAGVPADLTLSQVLDLIGGATWGDILFRGTAGWQRLAAGAAGLFLKTNGAGADPAWAAAGGGGGANWWAGNSPLAASFPTLVHGGAAIDLTLADDSAIGLMINPGAFSAVENVRFALQAAPANTSDWTVTARITPSLWPVNYNGVGIVHHETATGKNVISGFWFNGGAQYRVRRQTLTGFTADTYAGLHFTGNYSFWVRVRYVNASATFFFDVSSDGKQWVNATSVTNAVLFTTAPDKVGLGFYVNNGTAGATAFASCDYWQVVPPVGFSPASLFPATGAWYDPSDFSTLFQDVAGTIPVTAAGQNVGKMLDKSGNAHHATTPGGLIRPVLQQDAGGHYYLSFDGVSQALSTTWTSIAQPIDRVSALQQDTWAANRYMYDGGVVDEMILRQNGVTPQLELFAGAAACNNATATLATPWYVAERYNGASSSLTIRATAVNGNAGANATTGVFMGGRASGGGPFCPFRLYGIVVRGGTMTAAQLTALHTWLSTKSGAA